MRTPRDFRPSVSVRELEKRVALSAIAAMVATHGHHVVEAHAHKAPPVHGHNGKVHSAQVALAGSLGSGASLGFNPLNSSFVTTPAPLGSNAPGFTSPLGLEGSTAVNNSGGFLGAFIVINGVDIIGTGGADDGFMTSIEPFANTNAGVDASFTNTQQGLDTNGASSFESSLLTNSQTNVASSVNSSFVTNNSNLITTNQNDIDG